MKLTSVLVLLAVLVSFTDARGTILPPNDLYLQDDINRRDANITEKQFNEIIDNVISKFEPIVAKHGATLVAEKKWKDTTVNAYAQQTGNTWMVSMFGGLARRPEITPDGFALVVCHELGHHLGGFAFKGTRWAATEGQADYFATQACARVLWENETATNQTAGETVDAVAQNQCNKVWKNVADQNLCYRVSMASQSLATLLAFGGTLPKFDKPDPKVVSVTYTEHPQAQCRLDTYFSGALCHVQFDLSVIPGKDHPEGQTSVAAEKVANQYSCNRASGSVVGNRPNCWFKSLIQ